MSWISIALRVKPEFADLLGEALIARGSVGVWEAEPGWVTAYFPADADSGRVKVLLEEMSVSFGPGDCVISPVSDQDWIASWKASVTPLQVTPRLVVVPSWRRYEAAPGEQVVILDPGMAFGTGHHETTRMCLELLDECLQRGEAPLMLDLGTGSGILAIAAAKLGARRVIASEIDPEARRVAAENVVCNDVGSKVVVTDTEGTWSSAPYDLVVANLTAETLVALSSLIGTALARNGRAILGGVLAEREQVVTEALKPTGLEVCRRARAGEWVTLIVRGAGDAQSLDQMA